MPIINPDTSEVKELLPLEPGVYPATIAATEFKTSKAGNPMLVVTFEILHDDVVRKRNSYMVITGEGAYNFDSLLRAVGLDDYADRLKAGSKEPFDTDTLHGLELMVQVEQEAYQGRMVDSVRGFLKK